MKKTNIIASSIALAAIIAVAGATMSVSADEKTLGKGMGNGMVKWQSLTEDEKAELKENAQAKRGAMVENREAVFAALENSDYNAWLEAVGEDCPMAGKINEENFSRLVEAHKLKQASILIKEELGAGRKHFKARFSIE